jgi:hypothetical protein
MPVVSDTFDLNTVEWRRITDPSTKRFRVDFEYSLLGYDLATNRLDMLLRYGEQGHCRRHRHVASTITLVLEGEQFLEEMLPNGDTRSIQRSKGTYALANADALPHDEHGGEHGGTVLLSMTAASDGILFEYFDENMQNPWTVSIKEYVESWETGTAYGVGPKFGSVDSPLEPLVENSSSGPFSEFAVKNEEPNEGQAPLRESQEVSIDGREFELSKLSQPRLNLSPVSRFDALKARQTKRNWRVGVGLAVLISAMLALALYYIVASYNRTLPTSDRNLGDLTRPSLR